MATLTTVPVEEYLRTTYHPDREYVNGQLVERHVGEHHHSRMQIMLGAELYLRETERPFRAFTEQRVRVSEEPRYRIPDLCVKALPYDETPILVRPDLVIEIISPDDEPTDILEKVADYKAAGIPYIWVVNPHKRTLIEADQTGMRRAATLVLATPLVGEVDFAPLFAKLAKMAK